MFPRHLRPICKANDMLSTRDIDINPHNSLNAKHQ